MKIQFNKLVKLILILHAAGVFVFNMVHAQSVAPVQTAEKKTTVTPVAPKNSPKKEKVKSQVKKVAVKKQKVSHITPVEKSGTAASPKEEKK